MNTKKQLGAELEGLTALKGLVEVYEEVAAGRMQKVRGAVVQSRQFLDGLLEVFARVKRAYKGKTQKISRVRGQGGTVAVFIAANAKLYGDIVDRTFDKFKDYVTENKPQVVVLGKLGAKMMGEKMPRVLYNYFDFSDEEVDGESFEMVMRYLVQFEKILVFYGQFRTILSQDPVMKAVSGETVDLEAYTEASEQKQYLFEPSMDDVAAVFEGEILASLFEQTLHESQLAKFASRMLALDKAMDNIGERMNQMVWEERRLRHKLAGKKQLTTFSGIALWH